MAFHLGTGLATLATIAGHRLVGRFTGSKLHTNLWIMLVGNSGEARKTTAIRIGSELLHDVSPELLGSQPGSEEGLVDQLAAQENQIIVYGEFGQFLEKAQFGYMSALKTRYTQVYDGDRTGRSLARGRKHIAENPRLSLLSGITLEFLESFTTTVDWSGGFLNRFFVVVAERERTITSPVEDEETREQLASDLKLLSEGNLKTYAGLEPSAQKYWENWSQMREKKLAKEFSHDMVKGLTSRTPTLVLKIALLLAFDEGRCHGYTGLVGEDEQSGESPQFKLSYDNVRVASKIAEVQEDSALALASRIAENADRRDRRAVLRALNGEAASFGELIKRSRIQKRKLVPVVDSLVEEGALEKIASEQGVSYRKLEQ